jgi:uncharacterized membrane protein YqaE (UPF0057 family)
MSNFCNKHNKAKVHRKKPMRGWHCNECNNEKRQQWYKNDPRVVMLQSAKHRAKRDGVRFNLKKADIIIPIFCPVLGVPLQSGTRKQHDFAPTLDRVRTELGYVQGNIFVISYRANRIKNDATAEELERVLAYSKQ